MSELTAFDFGTVLCGGLVPAHKHQNPDGTTGGWVADTARVAATAHVGADAQVFGNAEVFDNARVFDKARVFDNARVFENARAFENVGVYGNARVYGDAGVRGNARVCDYVLVSGRAQVFGNAGIYGNARVRGNARVYDVLVCGHATVCENARVSSNGWTWGDHVAPPLDEQRALAREILAKIEAGCGLEMREWHTCPTTHCLAGWAQTLRGSAEEQVEERAYEFGVRFLPVLAPYFFESNEIALTKLREFVQVYDDARVAGQSEGRSL